MTSNGTWRQSPKEQATNKALNRRVPRGGKPPITSTCQKCNAEIPWLKQSNGKWIPTDEFGESRFQSCKRNKPSSGRHEVMGRTAGHGADVGFVYRGDVAPPYISWIDFPSAAA
jgi:hypothetical protein